MTIIFGDFDASNFWEDSAYAAKHYVEPSPDDALIAEVEASLGLKLPRSYIELCRVQNGGTPHNTSFRTTTRTSWADDHVSITGIYSIGKSAGYSLGGKMSTAFWVEEWGYPAIGIYFANCPSAGHDMIALDYRNCDESDEPCVVHVDQAAGFRITHLADSFETFIRGLESSDQFD